MVQSQVSRPGGRVIDLIPDDWGPKVLCAGADVTLTRRKADEIGFVADAHLLLILMTPQPGRETRLASSRSRRFDAPSGTTEIIPASADFQARWAVPKENILVVLAPDQLRDICLREFDRNAPELSPMNPGETDAVAHRIGALLRDELVQSVDASPLYVESLTTALIVQVLRHQSAMGARSAPGPIRGGLAPRTRRTVEDYMLSNLSTAISLGALAETAGLSYSHFLRAFRETVGVSPHRHLMQMRAQRAEHLVLSSQMPLKQIALDCGFASQSHMTTTMKRLLHITPSALRQLSRRGAPDE